MPNALFAVDDIVGFRPYGLGKMENVALESEGIRRYGWGPFRVIDRVEDRNGIQIHVRVSADGGQDAILPARWFILWDTHPRNEERLTAQNELGYFMDPMARYILRYEWNAVSVRSAMSSDAPIIWQFICDLAEYERGRDQVRVTPEIIRTQMESAPPPFECLIAEWRGEAIGFALFCTKYSTWEGCQTLWLEDIYVNPEFRRHNRTVSVGRFLLQELQRIAHERGYKRIEWWVLNWNESALRFYESLGARPMNEWTIWRLDPEIPS